MNPFMAAMQMAQNGKNPIQMLQQIMGSNPQFNQVMRVINSKDPASMKSTAEKMFKERGVDMEQFAKSMGITLWYGLGARSQVYINTKKGELYYG